MHVATRTGLVCLLACASAQAAEVQAPATVLVSAATFEMGKMVNYGYGDIDGPTRTVEIAKAFAMATHEVTLGEFRAFVEHTGHVSQGRCNVYENGSNWFIHPQRNWQSPGFPQEETHPVVCVSWRDTQAYIDWLSRATGRRYRLPSEAEFEYVASHGGLGEVVAHDRANLGKEECCGGKVSGKDRWLHTAPVGSFPADEFGLHDIRGNVWEWQDDCYHPTFEGAPVDGSARRVCPESDYRVVRGGSYGDAGDYVSPRFRLRGPVDEGYFTVGFRLVEDQAAAGPTRTVATPFEAARARDAAGVAASLTTSVEPEQIGRVLTDVLQ